MDKIKILCENIEKNIGGLKLKNSFDDYDSLEFDLLQLNSELSDYEHNYQTLKTENDLFMLGQYHTERQNFKSDVATNKYIENKHSEKLFTEQSQKNSVEMYNKKQKGYIRIADHIKSKFIREMGEAKRQAMVENAQYFNNNQKNDKNNDLGD